MWLIIAFSCPYIVIPYSYIFVHYFLLSPLHSPSAPPLSLFFQAFHLPLFTGFRSLVDYALLSGMPLVNIQVHLYVFDLRSPLVVPSFPYCKGYRQILQPCTGQEVVFSPQGWDYQTRTLWRNLLGVSFFFRDYFVLTSLLIVRVPQRDYVTMTNSAHRTGKAHFIFHLFLFSPNSISHLLFFQTR